MGESRRVCAHGSTLAQRLTKPSAICAGVQRCLLGTVFFLLLALLVLHAAFVGEGGCIHAALRDAAWGELTPETLPPNASSPERTSTRCEVRYLESEGILQRHCLGRFEPESRRT